MKNLFNFLLGIIVTSIILAIACCIVFLVCKYVFSATIAFIVFKIYAGFWGFCILSLLPLIGNGATKTAWELPKALGIVK